MFFLNVKICLFEFYTCLTAFNSVDFDILLGIQVSLNVSPPTISWFRSYLEGRSQSVSLKMIPRASAILRLVSLRA